LAAPLRMMKPLRTEAEVSLVTNLTTVSSAPPSMMVAAAPPTLLRVMALPLKSMFSV
jgi:hypothetical protein